MSSRLERTRPGGRAALLSVIAAALLAPAVPAGEPPVSAQDAPASAPAAEHARPTSAEIGAALEALRKDPNMGRERTIRSLRWVRSTDRPPDVHTPNWLVGLFRYLSETSRVLLWVAGGIVVAFAAIWAWRFARSRRIEEPAEEPSVVSHVQDLDIRPASLPADIGEAALTLLQRGNAREALSLLYRGALSRAVHRFSVVIRESYTEGEALRAVNRVMDSQRAQYFAAIVALWQRAVYAADVLPDEAVASLCREFSSTLGAAAV